jgi:hypothetical protein
VPAGAATSSKGIIIPNMHCLSPVCQRAEQTWLEKMIDNYPGFHNPLIPDVADHEVAVNTLKPMARFSARLGSVRNKPG